MIAIFFCGFCHAHDARSIFYQAFDFAKNESAFKDNIDWNQIEEKGLAFIGDKPLACRGISAISHILAPELFKYDYHTFVTENGLDSGECPLYKPHEISDYWHDWVQLSTVRRDFIKKKIETFWGKRFGDIAYIYIPSGFAYNDDEIEARIREGRSVVDSLNLETATGIIVDFRLNTGGNYVPMLMSLAKIINPATLFKYTHGESIRISEDGNTLLSLIPGEQEEILYKISYLPPVNRVNLPIVILIDEGTASSGAIAAFALKENSSTNQLLGEKTNPSLSVNASLQLNDGNYFNLMILRILSPTGLEQPLYLDSDIHVKHDFFSIFSTKDESIIQGINLIRDRVRRNTRGERYVLKS